jgi:ATP-dependent DNA ligase
MMDYISDVSPVRLSFVRPLSPSASARPPEGDGWIFEPKWDGFRFQVLKDGRGIRFYSRIGTEYTSRLPRMVEAFAKLRAADRAQARSQPALHQGKSAVPQAS